jgi:hypothetical protein
MYKIISAAVIFISSSLTSVYSAELRDEDWYQACASNAASSAKTKEALIVLLGVCDHKSVPKKCRGLSDNDGEVTRKSLNPGEIPFSLPSAFSADDAKQRMESSSRARCVASCKSANSFSRSFGDCAKG